MASKKDLVLEALDFKQPARTPFVVYTGVHAASLLGVTATEYLQSADLIVQGIQQAHSLYNADGYCTVFDLQIEAEALGCQLGWADDNPPHVKTHILSKQSLADLELPGPDDGRIPIALDATRRLVESLGDEVALFALVTGPFTLGLHLAGTDILTDMVLEPEKSKETLAFTAQVSKAICEYYLDTGVPVLSLVDPMTSQISPAMFEEFVLPALQPSWEVIRKAGRKSMLFTCGDATRNLELMARSGADGFAFDENVDLRKAKEFASQYKVAYGGNLALTTVMLFGTPEQNIAHANDLLEQGRGPGFILAPGCDVPYAVPPENIKAISDFVQGSVSTEQLAAALAATPDTEADELEEISFDPGTAKVRIDALTLDAAACPPCQYVMEIIQQVAKDYGDQVAYYEHMIKSREGLRWVHASGAKAIPTILINGKVAFSSIVPTAAELKAKIEEYL